jgi:hypothetical protein
MAAGKVDRSRTESELLEGFEGVDFWTELTNLFKEAREYDATIERRLLHIENLLLDIQFVIRKALLHQAEQGLTINNGSLGEGMTVIDSHGLAENGYLHRRATQ